MEKEEKSKTVDKGLLIALMVVAFAIGTLIGYYAFGLTKDEETKEEQNDTTKTENKELQNDDSSLETIYNESGFNVKCKSDMSACYVNNNELNVCIYSVEQLVNNEFIIANDCGNINYYLIDKSGKILFGEDSNYTYMEFKDNKLYYNHALIGYTDEYSYAKVVCGYYNDNDTVFNKYYMELENGTFKEAVLVKTQTVLDMKNETKDLDNYCLEMKTSFEN